MKKKKLRFSIKQRIDRFDQEGFNILIDWYSMYLKSLHKSITPNNTYNEIIENTQKDFSLKIKNKYLTDDIMKKNIWKVFLLYEDSQFHIKELFLDTKKNFFLYKKVEKKIRLILMTLYKKIPKLTPNNKNFYNKIIFKKRRGNLKNEK